MRLRKRSTEKRRGSRLRLHKKTEGAKRNFGRVLGRDATGRAVSTKRSKAKNAAGKAARKARKRNR